MVRYDHVCDQVLSTGDQADVTCRRLLPLLSSQPTLSLGNNSDTINHMHEDNASRTWLKKQEGRNLDPKMIAYSRTACLKLQLLHEKEINFYFVWTIAFWSLFVAVGSASLIILWTWDHLPSILSSLEKWRNWMSERLFNLPKRQIILAVQVRREASWRLTQCFPGLSVTWEAQRTLLHHVPGILRSTIEMLSKLWWLWTLTSCNLLNYIKFLPLLLSSFSDISHATYS